MSYRFPTPIASPTLLPRGEDDEGIILEPGSHTISYQQMPTWWFSDNLANLYWESDRLVLPAAGPNGALFRLRGADKPVFPYVNRQGKTAWTTSNADGSLVIVNANNEKLALFGGPNEKIEDGRVRFKIQTDTQLPSLMFEHKIRKSDANGLKVHRVVIHGNKSLQDVTYTGPEAVKAGKLDVSIPPKHKKAAEEGRLLAVTIHFGQSTHKQRHLNSVTVLHDSKDPGQSDRWTSNDDMINTLSSKEPRLGFDEAISLLFFGKDIKLVFLREIEPVDLNCMRSFGVAYDYWTHVMKIAIEHGPVWFYSMQPSFSTSSSGSQLTGRYLKPDSFPPIPFWIVMKFKAIVTDKGLTQLVPLEWGPIDNVRLSWHMCFSVSRES